MRSCLECGGCLSRVMVVMEAFLEAARDAQMIHFSADDGEGLGSEHF